MNGWSEVLNIGTLTTGGLLGITVLAILRGLLVPKSRVVELRADHESRIAALTTDKDAQITALRVEKAEWKDAWSGEFKARLALQEQNGELLELGRAASHSLTSIAQATGHDG